MHLIRYSFGLTVMTASLLVGVTQQSFAQIAITGGSLNLTASGTVFAPIQPNGSPIVDVQSIKVNSFNLNTQRGNFSSNAGNQFNATNFSGVSSVILNTSSARLSGQLEGTFSGTAFSPSGSPIMFSNIPSIMTGSVVVTANGPVNTSGGFAFATGNGNGEISGGTINTSGTPIMGGLLDSQLSFAGTGNNTSPTGNNTSPTGNNTSPTGNGIAITGGTGNITASGSVSPPSQPNGSPIVTVRSIKVNSFNLNTQQGNFSSNAGNQFNATNFSGVSSVILNTSSARLSGQLEGTFSGTAFSPSGSPIMFSNIPSIMTGSVVVTANGPVNTSGGFAFATGNGNGEISGGTINTSGTPIMGGLLDSQLSFDGKGNNTSPTGNNTSPTGNNTSPTGNGIAITGGTGNITASGSVSPPSQPNGSPIVTVRSIKVNSFNLNTQQGNFSSNAGNQFNATNFSGVSSVILNTSSARLSGQLEGTFSGTAFSPSGSPIMFSNIPSIMTGSVVVTADGPVNTSFGFVSATGNGNGEISGGTINTSGTPIMGGLLDSQLSFDGKGNGTGTVTGMDTGTVTGTGTKSFQPPNPFSPFPPNFSNSGISTSVQISDVIANKPGRTVITFEPAVIEVSRKPLDSSILPMPSMQQ